MNEEILEVILDKFQEIKQELMIYDIDLRSYDCEEYEDNEDLADALSLLSQLNEISERF